MKRLLAAIVAVGLIVGASAVRRTIDDDDGDDGAAPGDGRVVCATELRDVCMQLDGVDVTIEDATVTADQLATSGEDVGAWIVFEPWPAIVDDIRTRAGRPPLFEGRTAVARTRLVAVGPSSLETCDWRCLGDGTHRLGGRPLDSALGVVHVAAAASGWFGTSAYASNDFDAPFRSWLAGFTRSVTEDGAPVTRLLQSRAFFDAALSYEAEAQSALRDAAEDRKAGLALLYPEPVAHLDVAVVGGGASGALRDRLATLLVEAGWDEPSDASSGLPAAGVVIALREAIR